MDKNLPQIQSSVTNFDLQSKHPPQFLPTISDKSFLSYFKPTVKKTTKISNKSDFTRNINDDQLIGVRQPLESIEISLNQFLLSDNNINSFELILQSQMMTWSKDISKFIDFILNATLNHKIKKNEKNNQ